MNYIISDIVIKVSEICMTSFKGNPKAHFLYECFASHSMAYLAYHCGLFFDKE